MRFNIHLLACSQGGPETKEVSKAGRLSTNEDEALHCQEDGGGIIMSPTWTKSTSQDWLNIILLLLNKIKRVRRLLNLRQGETCPRQLSDIKRQRRCGRTNLYTECRLQGCCHHSPKTLDGTKKAMPKWTS